MMRRRAWGATVTRMNTTPGGRPVQSAGGRVMRRATSGRGARNGNAMDCPLRPGPTPATTAVPERTRIGFANHAEAWPVRTRVDVPAAEGVAC